MYISTVLSFCSHSLPGNIQILPFYMTNNNKNKTRMWANAQPDGRPAKHRWRPLFNATKFGSRPLLDAMQ